MTSRSLRRCALAAALLLALCQAPAQRNTDPQLTTTLLSNPASGSTDSPAAPWRVVGLPRQTKPLTRYSVQVVDGQRALRIEAQASYGNLVHDLTDPAEAAQRLRWTWRLDEPNAAADLRRKDSDDSPAKVCALFDLPTAALPFVDRQVLRLARLRSGEDLPAAVVCYVWDSRLPAGTVLDNAYSRRIRSIVLRGVGAPLLTWVSEQRDIAADFLRLFGDETKLLPPLVGIAVGADADNTLGRSLAWLRTITLD